MKFILLFIIYLIIFIGIIFKIKGFKICYFIYLIFVLFFRKSNKSFNTDFYLISWIPLILTNKTVLINILGNLIIFVPLGFIIKNIFYGLLLILLFENMQYILNRGVFDIVDIFLNSLGFVLVIASKEVYIWMMKKKLKNC